tara:strand:+ start:132 stop:2090 length:1959 start_codon:yes stop_codon:yes gene_type:complete
MALLAVALLLGTWIRVRGAVVYPFLADEPRITQSGVRDMLGIGPDRHLGTGLATQVFGVPLRNGQFLAPLWWWMQTGVLQLIPSHDDILYRGTDTRLYRLLPLVWGVVGLAAFYRLAAGVFRRPIPALVTLLLSAHDLHSYMSSKAQYTETVLFFATILMAFVLVRPRAGVKGRWMLACGAVLALAVFLAKGIALAIVMLVVMTMKLIPSSQLRNSRARLRGVGGDMRILLIAMLPLFAWWVGAEWFFRTHPVRVSDLGYFGHLLDPVLTLTLGYGEQVKSFTTGPWYWALLVYSQADIWPSLTFLALPIAVGCGIAVVGIMQGGWRRSMYIYIVVAIVLQLGVQLNKGVDGGRYHMLYLPASLLAAGLFFEWLWFRAEARLPGRLWGAAGIILIGAYVYFMFGWQHWLTTWVLPGRWGSNALLGGLAAGLLYLFGRGSSLRQWGVLGVAVLGVCISLGRGPLHWGMFAYEEPGSINPHRRAIEALYHPVHRVPEFSVQTDAVYADNLRLLGYDFDLGDDTLALTTHWQVEYHMRNASQRLIAFLNKALELELDKRLTQPYHLFLHLLDANSGELAYGLDEAMLNSRGIPVSQWRNGETVTLQHWLTISELPPGQYRLGIGLYDFESGERMPMTVGVSAGADWLPLKEFALR